MKTWTNTAVLRNMEQTFFSHTIAAQKDFFKKRKKKKVHPKPFAAGRFHGQIWKRGREAAPMGDSVASF